MLALVLVEKKKALLFKKKQNTTNCDRGQKQHLVGSWLV